MSADLTINCCAEELILCKERAVYWATRKILIVSDLHIGKSAFFRKNGVPVPGTVAQTDLQRLTELLKKYQTDILIVTGDMFHHKINIETTDFLTWRQQYSALRVVLIQGNHDTLKTEDYDSLDIEIHTRELLIFPFRFIHDKPKEVDEYYNITGHIHPGVVIYGRARQRLKFPCFYFSETYAVLPAFSLFTGLFLLKPAEKDQFYAITPEKVLKV